MTGREDIGAKAMMKYFMTDNQVIHEEEKLQDGVWVRMISPRRRNVRRLPMC